MSTMSFPSVSAPTRLRLRHAAAVLVPRGWVNPQVTVLE